MDTDESLNIIMRQTNYSKEMAEQKLKEHIGDIISVIREYNGPSRVNKPCTNPRSVNQQIYKEIRLMMDDAAKTYEEKKACESAVPNEVVPNEVVPNEVVPNEVVEQQQSN